MNSGNPSQTGNVNISGNLDLEGDIIGRDKIIQNIIVVGKVLDFAQADGLIPTPSDFPKLENIRDTIESGLRNRLGDDLTNATGIAGEILEPILSSWTPGKGEALPFRDILDSLAIPLVETLSKLGYWDNFCDPIRISISDTYYRALWLTSLSSLWKKHKRGDGDIGIAHTIAEGEGAYFLYREGENISKVSFKKFPREEFRIYIVGIVLDIVRMASIVSNDLDFWNQIIDSLTGNNQLQS